MILLEVQPGHEFDLNGIRYKVEDHTPGRFAEAGLTTTTFESPKLGQAEMTFNSLTIISTPPIP